MSLPCFEAVAGGFAAREAAPFGLRLRLEELSLDVRTNSEAVAEELRGYFAEFAVHAAFAGERPPGVADLRFLFLDGPAEEPPVELAVRPSAPGKRPDKERWADLPGRDGGPAGRIVRKQATGMLFLFGGDRNVAANIAPNIAPNIAIGPCARNRNQLVNFLCARYMERRLAAGWALGHAAGVARDGRALALCGFAGMGKSTLALHLLTRGLDFVSNDRVLIEPGAAGGCLPVLHGIPKHPRVNPGTALGNPELAGPLAAALPEASRRAYGGLAPEALRAVEDKFDARIDACFGPGRFRLAARLAGLVVLNWTHGGGGRFCARRVDLRQRPDLLEALRKPPGVLYLPWAIGELARLTPEACLEALDGAAVLEFSGGADFSAGAAACLDILG